MPTQIMVWEDSQGNIWRTQREAQEADAKAEEQAEVNAIAAILQTTSRGLGRRPGGLPQTIEEAAKIAIAAYPAMKEYYGD